MSEILITGMEMPKSCLGELDGRNDCPIVGICENFKKTAFNVRVEKSWNQRLENCPLIELPPHGDLINRGNILFLLQAEALGIDPKDKDFEGIKKGIMLARKAVNEAISIVPASDGEKHDRHEKEILQAQG